MVIATQNPVEHEGTYPLPEAQLDRFMMRLSIGYPSLQIEAEITRDAQRRPAPRGDRQRDGFAGHRGDDPAGATGHVAPTIRDYIVRIVDATRNHPDVYLGGSPRASIMLLAGGEGLRGSR